MSRYVTLDTTKAHLAIDHEGDDAYITLLLDIAENRVDDLILSSGYTAAEYATLIADARKLSIIKQAVLLLVSDTYFHRDGRATNEKTQDISFSLEKENYKVNELLRPLMRINI